MMNRRGFLGALLAGATLDPERLLWRPGAKLISIPKVSAIAESGILLYRNGMFQIPGLDYRLCGSTAVFYGELSELDLITVENPGYPRMYGAFSVMPRSVLVSDTPERREH